MPTALYSRILPAAAPVVGTRTMARFGRIWPGTRLRFDAFGGAATSPGNTVT